MAALLYSTTGQVRAIVGASDVELPDATIAARNTDMELTVDLYDWCPTHATIASDGTTGTPTADEIFKYQLLQLYSAHFHAALVLEAGQTTLLQKVSDGANEMARFTTADINDLHMHALAKCEHFKARLQDAIGETPEATTPHFFGVSGGYDPVTNVG